MGKKDENGEVIKDALECQDKGHGGNKEVPNLITVTGSKEEFCKLFEPRD